MPCNVDDFDYCEGASDGGLSLAEAAGFCSSEEVAVVSGTGAGAGADSTTGSDAGGAAGCQLSPRKTRIFASRSAISK